jgi:4'-phosphopantetheinyl transferase EntD
VRDFVGLFDTPSIVVLTSEVDDAAVALLTEREAALVERAIPKRKREFATARSLARAALSRFGHQGVEILNAPDRSPIWPDGVAGSITHSDTRAFVAVCAGSLGTVGVDTEHREELKRDLWKTVFLREEIAALDTMPEADRGRLALVLFSAKEALYKAQYPWTREFMGFHELRVDLRPSAHVGALAGRFDCVFQRDVGPFPEGGVVEGRWLSPGPGSALTEVVSGVHIGARAGEPLVRAGSKPGE